MLGCFSGDQGVDGEIQGRFAEMKGSFTAMQGCFGAMQVSIASGQARIAQRKCNARRRHGDRAVIPACATRRCHPHVHDPLPFRPYRCRET